jgi:hypothetical protein
LDSYLLHGGTQGPWGVHGYMYTGCYTDQGLWKGLFELSIYKPKNYPPTQDIDYASCKFDCFSGRHDLRSYFDCGKLDSGAVIKLYVF